MRTRWIVLTLVAALLGGGGYWYSSSNRTPDARPTSEQIKLVAATSGCYGASCNGKNPSGLCDDGITVASKVVKNGLLELRYSRSCKANWGRYTPWGPDARWYFLQGKGIYARVTAWNPGGPSYTTAHHDMSTDNTDSSWSQMVDGTKEACTGVEVLIVGSGNGDSQSQGWSWGPCY